MIWYSSRWYYHFWLLYYLYCMLLCKYMCNEYTSAGRAQWKITKYNIKNYKNYWHWWHWLMIVTKTIWRDICCRFISHVVMPFWLHVVLRSWNFHDHAFGFARNGLWCLWCKVMAVPILLWESWRQESTDLLYTWILHVGTRSLPQEVFQQNAIEC